MTHNSVAGPGDVVHAQCVLAGRDGQVDGLADGRGDVAPQVDLPCAVDVEAHAVLGGGREPEGAAGAEVPGEAPAYGEVVLRQGHPSGTAAAVVLGDGGIAGGPLGRAAER